MKLIKTVYAATDAGTKAFDEFNKLADTPNNTRLSNDLPQSIAIVLNFAYGALGLIALLSVMYSGIRIMNAGGDAELVKKEQKRLIYAAIGAGVVLMAYSITFFVTRQFTR